MVAEVALSIQYADDHLDLASFDLSLDGQPVASAVSASATGASGQLVGLAEGPHVLVAGIGDESGNWTGVTTHFQVSLAPPPAHELYLLEGGESLALFGFAVEAAGDVDGDGFADLVVGAHGSDAGATNGGQVWVHSGRDGKVLHQIDGQVANGGLGFAVAGLGDLDGDGLGDVLAGSSSEETGGPGTGAARVFSGADGGELFAVFGQLPGDGLGASVAALGDVNGDGVPDWAAGGSLSDAAFPNSGRAEVFSGADASRIFAVDGDAEAQKLAIAMDGPGDLDGDGRNDLLVGMWGDGTFGPSAGAARVVSGLDGSTLFTVYGDQASDHMGNDVAGAGDVNADGVPDFIVAAWASDVGGLATGLARVYSGLDAGELFTYHGLGPGDQLGSAVDGAGDVDLDGFADLLVCAFQEPHPSGATGVARIFSGHTGELLRLHHGQPANTQYGLDASFLGDVDGDAIADYAVGAPWAAPAGPLSGVVHVYGGSSILAGASAASLSVELGGGIVFQLDAGSGHADSGYMLLGSTSGVWPGSLLGSTHLPLNDDPYLQATLSSPGFGFASGDSWSVQGNLGQLDGDGRCAALLSLEAGANPALVGLTIEHAFVFGPGFELVSRPLALELE